VLRTGCQWRSALDQTELVGHSTAYNVPVGLVVAGANRHGMKRTRATQECMVMLRPEPTAEHPQGLCLDKGYDYQMVSEALKPEPNPAVRT